MFDRSSLPSADWEFVLLADTHFMLDVPTVEFDSRRRQTARIEHAIQLINALDPAFVVHLGDVVQAFPGTSEFDRAMGAAQRQLDRLDPDCHVVPGNHDVGDKPDPTMPTEPASSTSIAAHHERFGRSWAHWEAGGIDFVTINSQLLNSTLEAADEQQAWLDATLRTRISEPTFLFSHLPPFLSDPADPGLGHYDVIASPARDWLLDLVRESPVSHVFSAHTHFQFLNRMEDTEFYVLPSPAFTRPGFAEVFSSCPPSERGRDDRPKLGFYLARMRDGEPTFHFIRTGGRTNPGWETPTEALLTLPTGAIPASRLGVSLVHPLVQTAAVPATFPASVQSRIHDDYPLLGCLELGAALLRLPVRDGSSSDYTRNHLEYFRERGGTIIGTTFETTAGSNSGNDEPDPDDLSAVPVDEVELRVLGDVWPTAATAAGIESVRRATSLPVGLSLAVPDRAVPGKQHDRPRIGYRPAELATLDARLEDLAAHVDRVICRVGATEDPWDVIRDTPASDSFAHIGAIDWLLPSTDLDEPTHVDRLCGGLLASATRPRSRLYLEPLRALDRTMDGAPGLLDRQRNPTAAFRAARSLNTVVFGSNEAWRPVNDRHHPNGRILGVADADRVNLLALPRPTGEPFRFDWPLDLPSISHARRIELPRGTSTPVEEPASEAVVRRPTVFVIE